MDYMDYLIIWAIFIICFLLSLYIGRRKDITYDDYEDGAVEPIPELDVTALYKTRFIRNGVVGHPSDDTRPDVARPVALVEASQNQRAINPE